MQAGSGSGRKWPGPATLPERIRFLIKKNLNLDPKKRKKGPSGTGNSPVVAWRVLANLTAASSMLATPLRRWSRSSEPSLAGRFRCHEVTRRQAISYDTTTHKPSLNLSELSLPPRNRSTKSSGKLFSGGNIRRIALGQSAAQWIF